MRYSCTQLRRLRCSASTKGLCPVEHTRTPCSAGIQISQTRHLSSSKYGYHQIYTTTHLGTRLDCKLRKEPLTRTVRAYSTALATANSPSEDRHDQVRGEDQPYTGTFAETSPTAAGIRALKTSKPLAYHELLDPWNLFPHALERLRSHGSVVTFDSFEGWHEVVPILAERLGLQHVTITSSNSYYEHVAEQNGEFHVLVNPVEQQPARAKVDDVVVEHLRSNIVGKDFEHWLRKFRLDLKSPSKFIWRFFMLVCRNSPPAMPRVGISQAGLPSATESSPASSHPPPQLTLVNHQFNISVVKSLDAKAGLSRRTLDDALLDYLEALHNAEPSDAAYSFRFLPGMGEPAEFLGQGFKALGWGDVRFQEAVKEEILPSIRAEGLWMARICNSTHEQLDGPNIWHNRKYARLLAILHGCNVVKSHLIDAYKNGQLSRQEFESFARHWAESMPINKQNDREVAGISGPVIHEVVVNEKIVSSMLHALRALVNAGFPSVYSWSSAGTAGLEVPQVQTMAVRKSHRLDHRLYRELLRRAEKSVPGPLDLPVRNEKICSRIREAISDSAVTIITAATGSGKTTQVPQIILDECIAAQNGSMCNIICTQPRRVSTIAVATRVASERRQPLGRDIGYKVRFDVRPTALDCGITYMTSGYLSRILESNPHEILNKHSHIILDEVHARDVDTDIILATLKNLLGARSEMKVAKIPKLILMSATINTGFFKDYFSDLGPDVRVATISVPGKMYHIEDKKLDHVVPELQESHSHHLTRLLALPEVGRYVNEQMNTTGSNEHDAHDDNRFTTSARSTNVDEAAVTNQELLVPIPLLHLMVVRLLSTTSSGDILVFLPGLGEIDALETLLRTDPLSQSDMAISHRYKIFKLHSALYETNYDVFKEIPSGCRRIVLATNIAETSITLPDVEYVIDTGLSRQNTFDQVAQSGTFGLHWISKAEVMQRKGRAGRTQAGVYYGMYSQAQHDAMPDAPTPEILRMSLDNLVLRCASSRASDLRTMIEPGVPDQKRLLTGHALLTTPSPPEASHVAAAAQQLRNMHALTAEGKTTAMGKVLSRFPMSPAAAKAVLLGIIFRCLDAMLIFGALRDDSPLMYDPNGIGGIAERRRKLANGTDDDRWADSQAFISYDRLRRQEGKEAAMQLQQELSIRHDAYCEIAQTAKQTFETFQPMLGLAEHDQSIDEDDDMPRPLFPSTPPTLSTNAANADLVKALALSTVGSRLACWNHKNWRASLHSRVLPHPKSVNHNASRRAMLVQRLRRENGDLLTYGTMRTIPRDKYPWLHDTSAVTPLMAILFAESISLAEDGCTFVIDGWLRYELTSTIPDSDIQYNAKVIWEYRKALDRFVALAMQMISIEPHKLEKVKNGELKAADLNTFFQLKDNLFREIIMNSVIEVLGIDGKDRKERAVVRALEQEGVDSDVAEKVQEKVDFEMLINMVVERDRNENAARQKKSRNTKQAVVTNDSEDEGSVTGDPLSDDVEETDPSNDIVPPNVKQKTRKTGSKTTI